MNLSHLRWKEELHLPLKKLISTCLGDLCRQRKTQIFSLRSPNLPAVESKIQRWHLCKESGWDGVNFLCGSWCDAVFYTGDKNSADSTPMFLLLLNGACTASGPSLLLTLPPRWIDGGHTRGWEGTPPDRWDQITTEISHLMSCSAKRREKRGI